MPSALVQKFRNDTAPRLLAKFNNDGVRVVLRELLPNPDPLRPSVEVFTERDIDAYASGISAQLRAVDPDLAEASLQVIVAAIAFDPSVADFVEINGEKRAVVKVIPIPAAGPPAIYKFFVR